MDHVNIDALRDFFYSVERLKDTLRSGHTANGRPESTAEHTWQLCLMAVALEEELVGLDTARLLRMLVLHDLAEVVHGDIPAPEQTGDKTADERIDMVNLLSSLPDVSATRMLALWDEYNAAETAEARVAKGLDRLETVMQHVQGKNPEDFDYGFNLQYGRQHTDSHPLIAELRAPIDAETKRRAKGK